MKIWIDLDNSPHIPFFHPIIEELEARGFSCVLTARNCYQVCGLVDLYRLDCTVIGKHYGKNKLFKVWGMLTRSLQLLAFARKTRPTVALSHGSRAQLLAAAAYGIPVFIAIDYEFGQRVPFVNPDLYIVPEVLKDSHPWPPDIVKSYPGIKEDVYVPFFKPDPSILETLGIRQGGALVTVRPPASEAHYHNPQSEELFTEVMEHFGKRDDVQMVILPRSEAQAVEIREKWSELIQRRKAIVPDQVLDGLNLMWHSDLVISGGGTMNREAAALGVPVYSIFKGSIGAVDRYLEKAGRLILLDAPQDVRNKIQVRKRLTGRNAVSNGHGALQAIVNQVIEAAQERGA